MIETEAQRRWWFATHPELSGGRRGDRVGKHKKGKGESDEVSPEVVDAYVEQALEHETDDVVIEMLKRTKFWFGSEFDSKTAEEQRALLWGDDDGDGSPDEPANKGGNHQTSRAPKGHPAASKAGYTQYEDVLDRVEDYQQEIFERAIEQDKKGLEPDPHTFLDLFPWRRLVTSPVGFVRGLVRGAARGTVVHAVKKAGSKGPGTWVEVPRGPNGMAHQSKMSGQQIRESGGRLYIKEYEVNGVKFDDYKNGKLYEYKGPHGHLFDKNNDLRPWVKDPGEMRKQAVRQAKAAKGIPVIWRVGAHQVKAFKNAVGKVRGVEIVP